MTVFAATELCVPEAGGLAPGWFDEDCPAVAMFTSQTASKTTAALPTAAAASWHAPATCPRWCSPTSPAATATAS